MIASLYQDVRFAIRGMIKAKGLTAIVLLSLAVGIGVNSAVFSVVDALLLRPLPYPESSRLVAIYNPNTHSGTERGMFSPQDEDDFIRQSTSYESVASYLYTPGLSGMDLSGVGDPVRLEVAHVSGNFFATLRTTAQQGRMLQPADDVVGADRQVVISDGLWRSQFGADPGVIGRTVTLEEQTFTIVGVTPRSFELPSRDVQIWAPVSLIGDDDIPHRRGLRWLNLVARLKPDVSREAAASEANVIMQRLAQTYPDTNRNTGSAQVVSLQQALVGDRRPVLLIVFGTVAFVLVIACANIANLLLARGTDRQKEYAVRAAMGASPSALVRQTLVEAITLAVAGGIAGVVVGAGIVRALRGVSGPTAEVMLQVQFDFRVAMFAAIASVLTGVAFGMLPALRASRIQPQTALAASSRTSGEGRQVTATRSWLVTSEVAIATTVLVASLLALQSLWSLLQVNPGIEAQRVLAVQLRVPESRTEIPEGTRNYRNAIIERVAAVPGVQSVSSSKTMPLNGGSEPYEVSLLPEGAVNRSITRTGVFMVSPGYFDTLGVPIITGRDISAFDEQKDAPLVAVINRRFAEVYFGAQDPVERLLYIGTDPIKVVGVAGDVRHEGLAGPVSPAVYLPSGKLPRSSLKLFVRASGEPMALAGAIRAAIREADKNAPVEFTPMQDVISRQTSQPRAVAFLLLSFGAIAVFLAGMGVYGVLAYNVRRQSHEIGVRIALGATQKHIVSMIVGHSLKLTFIGLALGTLAGFLGTRIMASVLYGVRPLDAVPYLAAMLTLTLVAVFASALPALRALRIDPSLALRAE